MKIEIEPVRISGAWVARIEGEKPESGSPGMGVIVESSWVALIDALADHLRSMRPPEGA